MRQPEKGRLLIIYFKKGLQPLLGYFITKTKGLLWWKKSVDIWESTEGSELDEEMIRHWKYLDDK
jgi:hypothetical protein